MKNEVIKIPKLSKPIDLHIDVLHYSSIVLDKRKFEKNKELFKTKEFDNFKLNIQKNNLVISILNSVSQYVTKTKPELLIIFTKREKSFFDSLFLPSKSADLTYSTKTPVLIFSK